MQIVARTCGDRALETVLDIFEAALKDSSRKDFRYCLEHGSVIPTRLIERIR